MIIRNQAGHVSAASTRLLTYTAGTVLAIDGDTITTSADGHPTTALTTGCAGLAGLYIEIGARQYEIVSSTANALTLRNPDPAPLAEQIAVGASYRDPSRADESLNLIIDGGGSSVLTLDGNRGFANLTLRNGAVLTCPDTTSTKEYVFDLAVVNRLEIDATSRIDVTAKGYIGGNGVDYGRTYGNANGAYLRAGGSYGGVGSLAYYDRGVSIPNGVYGDYRNPLELGSGGGRWGGSYGGDGGGLILLAAGQLYLDGSIRANGGGGYNGGSGGGINVHVGTLSGTGSIQANGATTNSGDGYASGGGGGRIAIYYDNANGYDFANVTAYGGTGYGGITGDCVAGAGTVYLENRAIQQAGIGTLVVDNGGRNASSSTPILAAPSGTILSVDGLRSELVSASSAFPVGRNALGASGLEGLWIQPDSTKAFFYPIVSNTEQTLSVADWDGSFPAIAQSGLSFRGATLAGNVQVKGKAKVTSSSPLFIVGGELIESDGGVWSGPVERIDGLNGGIQEHRLSASGAYTSGQIHPDGNLLVEGAHIRFDGPIVLHGLRMLPGSVLEADSITASGNVMLSGATLISDDVEVAGTFSVMHGSLVRSEATTATGEHRLNIDSKTLHVDGTSRIDVSSLGYPGGMTSGGASFEAASAGGCHGGIGGSDEGAAGNAYGDPMYPVSLGGGSGLIESGRSGGGAVLVSVDDLVLDGAILANGTGYLFGLQAGGGAGGSILVDALRINGGGILAANGGTGAGLSGGGGGGGRIALYFDENAVPPKFVTALGGDVSDSTARRGNPGSLYFENRLQDQPGGGTLLDGDATLPEPEPSAN